MIVSTQNLTFLIIHKEQEVKTMDPRIICFADILVNYSVKIQKGEIVIIECFDLVPREMVYAMIDSVHKAGGCPVVWIKDESIFCKLLNGSDEQTVKLYAEHELAMMKKASAYIGIRAYENSSDRSGISDEKMALFKEHWNTPVHHDERVKNTKWVVTRWPSPNMAQSAKMSTPAFEDFFFGACTEVDYHKMSKNMDPLVELMEKTDRVRIIGPGTDLQFSIKDIPAIKCDGEKNIPDGEVFTAPVRSSANGTILFNTSTIYEGKSFSKVSLVFRDGRIVECGCEGGDQKAMDGIFDTDEGARFVGEFAFGLNSKILDDVGDILFDEKIAGSFHFTPGAAYDEAYNGNESQIHWDLVCIQTVERGGGEIWFDGVLIRKDGIFVLSELEALNQ